MIIDLVIHFDFNLLLWCYLDLVSKSAKRSTINGLHKNLRIVWLKNVLMKKVYAHVQF